MPILSYELIYAAKKPKSCFLLTLTVFLIGKNLVTFWQRKEQVLPFTQLKSYSIESYCNKVG